MADLHSELEKKLAEIVERHRCDGWETCHHCSSIPSDFAEAVREAVDAALEHGAKSLEAIARTCSSHTDAAIYRYAAAALRREKTPTTVEKGGERG